MQTTYCPILSMGGPDIKKCMAAQCELWTRDDYGDFHCAIKVTANTLLAMLTRAGKAAKDR